MAARRAAGNGGTSGRAPSGGLAAPVAGSAPAPGSLPGPGPLAYPFAAIVGMDDLKMALLLNAVSPAIGGVLVRGEKGTAKSTVVRALAELLPPVRVVTACRFSCDPADPDPACPDGPHPPEAPSHIRPARLAELPVGATEDRLLGSLDIERALTHGVTAYEPGLLAAAHRGLLYVDEVNLLHDHLVDLLLDAAALGVSYVEREGVSVRHAARFLLVGTMNPEEGELRPQLLDRFGLTVQVRASRDPAERAEVVRRRLAFEAAPGAFCAAFAADTERLAARVTAATARLGAVSLPDSALRQICAACGAFGVDGLRADLVTARASIALAAWNGRDVVSTDDVRQAARLALPHRRRRDPFDPPDLDSRALDEALSEALAGAAPEQAGGGPGDDPDDDPEGPGGGPGGGREAAPVTVGGGGPEPEAAGPAEPGALAGQGGRSDPAGPAGAAGPTSAAGPAGTAGPAGAAGHAAGPAAPARASSAEPGRTFRPRLLTVPGVGRGVRGRRSQARVPHGRTVGARLPAGRITALHLPATLRAAAPHQRNRGRPPEGAGPGAGLQVGVDLGGGILRGGSPRGGAPSGGSPRAEGPGGGALRGGSLSGGAPGGRSNVLNGPLVFTGEHQWTIGHERRGARPGPGGAVPGPAGPGGAVPGPAGPGGAVAGRGGPVPGQAAPRAHELGTAPAPARSGKAAARGRLVLKPADLREAVRVGREGNLVLFAVDASGSMAARQRMRVVKAAVLSLLLDAYQRRDKIGLVTFAGSSAEVALPPTSSVETGARRLATLPTGGRTPLAAGLARAADVLAAERLRDPDRRPLLVVVTDGRATFGTDADLARAAARLAGVPTVVVDCEHGPVRLGLAARLADALGAVPLRLDDLAAGALTSVVARRSAA